MCGFFFTRNIPDIKIGKFLKLMKSRGPDSTEELEINNIKCGFNRLSIINQDNNSNQPMFDISRRYLILFNGELYNYLELKKELKKNFKINFTTTSDTEIVLYSLIYYGKNSVKKFDGIFSIIFYDKLLDTILLIRDRFGIKPLYYHLKNKQLTISSEIKPIIKSVKTSLNLNRCVSYLSIGCFIDENTFLDNVKTVEPGNIVSVNKNSRLKTFNYNHFSYNNNFKPSKNKIRQTIEKAISSQVPNTNFGVLFSGGLDSSIILKNVFKYKNFNSLYSTQVEDSDMNEKKFQNIIIESLNLKKKSLKVINNKTSFKLQSLKMIADNFDLPVIHPNFIGSYFMSKLASENKLKVLLSGEGADEVFLGYKWFLNENVNKNCFEYAKISDLCNLFSLSKKIDTSKIKNMSIEDKFQKIFIQKWLIRQDLSGMTNGVEIRVPFLSNDLVNLINNINYGDKIKNNITKHILKKYAEKHFDKNFIYRKKIGFDYSLNNWINKHHFNFLINNNDFINSRFLKKLWENRTNDYYVPRTIFVLVMFTFWLKSI